MTATFHHVKLLAAALALAVPLSAARAGEASGTVHLSAEVDRLFSAVATDHTPGCAVGVVHDGQWLHKRGYGMAGLEHRIPITSRTLFRVASVSKQFTAASILLLAQRGELSLDADIRGLLPFLPDYGTLVTVRHLLHHTAGLPQETEELGMSVEAAPDYFADYPELFTDDSYLSDRYIPTSEFRRRIAAVSTLRFAPGSRFEYNNPGYFLLGQIVEAVSGLSLRRFAAQQLFEPLGMNDTHYKDRAREVTPGVALGYLVLPDGGVLRYDVDLDYVGDGGVYTSLEDFYRWDRNFFDNRLGAAGAAMMEQMQTPNLDTTYPEDSGPYGMGLRIDRYAGQRRVHHSGHYQAYAAHVARFPDARLSTYIFCNSPLVEPTDLADRIADLYLPHL